MTSPTTNQYTKYQKLYDYFNRKLFKKELPFCLLILSRRSARVCGHFSRNRWSDKEGNKTHEINLNPIYLATATDIDICQTLVHEMVHLWQYEFGKPSRAGYHNKEWAKKMEEVGLTPSDTGLPNGKKTGQQMSDYPTPNGVFLKVFDKMSKEILLPFKSFELSQGVAIMGSSGQSDNEEGEGEAKPKPRKAKNKYSCPCGNNVWGKPDLKINCGECEKPFEMVEKT